MKKIIYINTIILTILIFIGCDKVTTPIQKNDTVPDTAITKKYRKVLLEDHTGNRCPNCPAAALEAEKLKLKYGKNLIIIGEHSSFLSSKANEAAPFNYTLQNPVSEAFFADFGINKLGKPYAIINRLGYKQGTIAIKPDNWAGEVDKLMGQDAKATIELKTDYDTVTHKLIVNVTCEFLRDELNATYNLSLLLLEDNIIGAQLQNGVTGGTVLDYVHQHVLRYSFSGNYGELLINGSNITKGQKFTKTYQVIITDAVKTVPLINEKNISVVAFIHNSDINADGYRQIIQAEEVKLK